MNNKLLLFAFAIVTFASCTTVYKSGQTPDDVYYSPVRMYDETRKEDTKDDRIDYRDFNAETRQIRMGINDRRWRNFDNEISYNPYLFGYNYGYYYNPFYWAQPVYNPVIFVANNPRNTTPRTTNLNGYGNGYINNNVNINPKTGTRVAVPARVYNNGSKLGNVLRGVLNSETPRYNNNNNNNNNNNRNNNNTQSNRSYTPSTSSGSSSSSGGTITRPARNGKDN